MTPEQREAKRVYDDAWEQDHREERRAYSAAYRSAHREEKRAYGAAYYAEHRDEVAAYHAAYNEAHRDAIREKNAKEFAGFHEWLQILRTNNGCEDCETHEGKLEHHHPDPTTKLYNVSKMCSRSLDALEDELEKCVVLCRPCHKKRHVAMRANARAVA